MEDDFATIGIQQSAHVARKDSRVYRNVPHWLLHLHPVRIAMLMVGVYIRRRYYRGVLVPGGDLLVKEVQTVRKVTKRMRTKIEVAEWINLSRHLQKVSSWDLEYTLCVFYFVQKCPALPQTEAARW